MRMPPLKAQQVFEAVARLGSVSKAATELGVTGGAVSQQIQLLEQALGAPLFMRSARQLRLNAEGERYYAALGPAFATLRAAARDIMGAGIDAPLIVNCLPSLASRWVSPQILRWSDKPQALTIRLVGATHEPDPAREPYDFRIGYGHSGSKDCQPLFHDRMLPVCTPDFLKDRRITTAAELMAAPLIHVVWDARYAVTPGWADWAKQAGLAIAPIAVPALTFSLSAAAIDAALAGNGFALAPFSMVVEELATGRLVAPIAIRMPMPEPYCITVSPLAARRRGTAEFLQWLLAAGAAQQILSDGR